MHICKFIFSVFARFCRPPNVCAGRGIWRWPGPGRYITQLNQTRKEIWFTVLVWFSWVMSCHAHRTAVAQIGSFSYIHKNLNDLISWTCSHFRIDVLYLSIISKLFECVSIYSLKNSFSIMSWTKQKMWTIFGWKESKFQIELYADENDNQIQLKNFLPIL